MRVLVGAASDGWNRSGYVALFPGQVTESKRTLLELVALLKHAGVQASEIHLADPNDHTHAMSQVEQSEFWTYWSAEP